MRWWHRHEERVKDAEHEVEVSRELLRETREKVIKPLAKAAARNNFAELIAATLNNHAMRGNNNHA